MRAFQKAVEIKPDFTDALFNLGMGYKTVGRYREAREKLQEVLQLNPSHSEAKENLRKIEKVSQ
jgi:superkiller protein 3